MPPLSRIEPQHGHGRADEFVFRCPGAGRVGLRMRPVRRSRQRTRAGQQHEVANLPNACTRKRFVLHDLLDPAAIRQRTPGTGDTAVGSQGMEYSLGQRSFPRLVQIIGRFRNDETRQVRRERVSHRVADQYARPRSVQPHVVEPVANCGDLARIVIHGDHMQVRLPDEFLDQAATVDPQHQGVTVANARGLQDGVGFLGPLVGGRVEGCWTPCASSLHQAAERQRPECFPRPSR